MLLIIFAVGFLLFWWQSPHLRDRFWNLLRGKDRSERSESQIEEVGFESDVEDLERYSTSSMEEYLEKKRLAEQRLGPAVNIQGEEVNELRSPSLDQFKELYQQAQIGGR